MVKRFAWKSLALTGCSFPGAGLETQARAFLFAAETSAIKGAKAQAAKNIEIQVEAGLCSEKFAVSAQADRGYMK